MVMEIEALKSRFYAMVAPSLPNEWDVEEALTPLADGSGQYIEEIFAQIPAIWPVSHSLCFAYIFAAENALQTLALDELSLWVHSLLDRYEKGGLRAAQLFMGNVDQYFVRQIRGQGGLQLTEVLSRLQPYVNGLAGKELPIVAGGLASTDTESIFVPNEIDLFAGNEDNFLLYKLMISFQWASIRIGTFTAPRSYAPPDVLAHPLEHYFAGLSHPQLACIFYHFFETARAMAFLRQELPGLMRQAAAILPKLSPARDTEKNHLLHRFQKRLLHIHSPQTAEPAQLEEWATTLLAESEHGESNQASLQAVCTLLPHLSEDDDCTGLEPLFFQGTLRLKEAWSMHIRRRQERETQFIKAMSAHLQMERRMNNKQQADEARQNEKISNQGQDIALIIEPGLQQSEKTRPSQTIRIDNEEIELSEELSELAEKIRNDLGELPEDYITSAAGLAGQGFDPQQTSGLEEGSGFIQPVVYDEWDYRRKGFRKNWCVVTEREMQQVQTPFIDQTLQKYKGQIRRLRHQFELMRTGERFVRRQREGNDIDLDALVESLSDIHAGRAPSDRVFIRLTRDQRDIAVYFLVDMSNSTAGWVGKSIKEALVLICEAMEVLNDRYGIYGFSGMRRLRCEVFPVKRLEERYSSAVRQRISAIGPREYTRMAPAIRHVTSLFHGVEAKIRLMIILSDGKPEDYDDYKGTYAIEDTRHALLEAKTRGIHPFCITIDRKAHEYMAHMYGEVNYIFIDEVRQLPARMPEIYRVLTT